MVDGIRQRSSLIITSSGGAGHKAVAGVRRNAILGTDKGLAAADPANIAPWKDMMKDILPKWIGDRAVNSWNTAQQTGDVAKQKKLVDQQPLAEFIFFLPIFFQTLRTLFSMDPPPKEIINTQVMGCSAMLYALDLYNFIQRHRFKKTDQPWEDVKMQLWMTDLVSEKAVHFMRPLSKLSKDHKSKLTVCIPSLGKMERDGANTMMFGDTTGIDVKNIKFLNVNELPVNPIFLQDELRAISPQTTRDVKIGLKLNNEQEASFLGIVEEDQLDRTGGSIKYIIPSGDNVYSLMLGSQPTEHVINEFVDKLIEATVARPDGKMTRAFLFCGNDVAGSPSIYKRVVAKITALKAERKIPENVKFIPLPFQDPDNIARVMSRSNRRFTRAGGSTAYELLSLNHNITEGKVTGPRAGRSDDENKAIVKAEKDLYGRFMVVAEGSVKDEKEQLFDNIPVWEGGNAEQLRDSINARVTHSSRFLKIFGKDASVVDSSKAGRERRARREEIETRRVFSLIPDRVGPIAFDGSEIIAIAADALLSAAGNSIDEASIIKKMDEGSLRTFAEDAQLYANKDGMNEDFAEFLADAEPKAGELIQKITQQVKTAKVADQHFENNDFGDWGHRQQNIPKDIERDY